jgi:hypothetical protein
MISPLQLQRLAFRYVGLRWVSPTGRGGDQSRLSGMWFHWFLGDVPDSLRKALVMLGLAGYPRSHSAMVGHKDSWAGWRNGKLTQVAGLQKTCRGLTSAKAGEYLSPPITSSLSKRWALGSAFFFPLIQTHHEQRNPVRPRIHGEGERHSRADMISTIINAIKTAALKGVNSGQELKD